MDSGLRPLEGPEKRGSVITLASGWKTNLEGEIKRDDGGLNYSGNSRGGEEVTGARVEGALSELNLKN